MKLTNNSGLPQALFDAIKNDGYSKGEADFSVTELLKPARQRALQIQHAEEIEEDVEDRIWSLLGQSVHTILERANRESLVEKRFFMKIDEHTISGQIDTLDLRNGTLSDWKVTSAWGFSGNKPPKPEYTQQLNMQFMLLEKNGHRAKKLQIVAILRDWQKSKAKLQKNYPQKPIIIQPIETWTIEETELFMRERIHAHEQAAKHLPECTPEETWNSRRCQDYCNVAPHCSQYQKIKQQQKDTYL